jgi:hypothetical protein
VPESILQLKVTLSHIRPPIWRRIEVAGDTSLFDLHRVIQSAMGWTDSHLHQFDQNGLTYGPPDREFGEPVISERKTRVSQLLSTPKSRLMYTYDFGDWWEHDVILESTKAPLSDARYPRVIDGKRACPPEDVGGPPGYAQFLEAVSNPGHPEHPSLTEWIGGPFDPEHFDAIIANERVPRQRRARRAPNER